MPNAPVTSCVNHSPYSRKACRRCGNFICHLCADRYHDKHCVRCIVLMTGRSRNLSLLPIIVTVTLGAYFVLNGRLEYPVLGCPRLWTPLFYCQCLGLFGPSLGLLLAHKEYKKALWSAPFGAAVTLVWVLYNTSRTDF